MLSENWTSFQERKAPPASYTSGLGKGKKSLTDSSLSEKREGPHLGEKALFPNPIPLFLCEEVELTLLFFHPRSPLRVALMGEADRELLASSFFWKLKDPFLPPE